MPYKYNVITKKLDYYETGSESITITEDTTYYVDGDSGDDSNDGLSWSNAKKTFSFLYSGGTNPLPREVNSNITVYARNTIYIHDNTDSNYKNLYLDNFKGTGSISIEGVPTTVESTITPTGWDNTITSVTYRSYVDVSTASWTVDEHKGRYIERTSSPGTYYPILSNTATRLEVCNAPIVSGSHTFNIVEMPLLKGAMVNDPGTPLPESTYYNFLTAAQINLNNCKINLNVEKLNCYNSDESIGQITIQGNCEEVNLTNVNGSVINGFKIFSNQGINIRRCMFNYYTSTFESYCSIFYLSYCSVYFRQCAIKGVGTSGVAHTGIYCDVFGDLLVGRCRIENFTTGIRTFYSNIPKLDYGNLIKDCETGILFESEFSYIFSTGTTRYTYFDNCTNAISLTSSRFTTDTLMSYITNSVTNDIAVAFDPLVSYSFTDLDNQIPIINTATGTKVLYFDGTTYNYKNNSDINYNNDVDSAASEVIDEVNFTSIEAVWWDYFVSSNSGSNKRAGTISCTWDNTTTSAVMDDYSSSEIGTTSGVTFSVNYNSGTGNVELLATVTTDNWTIKVRKRTI